MGSIYIVEDNNATRLIIKRILKRKGYSICGESDSGEKLISDLKLKKPDLIIMDIGLKGKLNGIQTSQIVFERYNLPVIFLSSRKDESTLINAQLTNPYIYIIKPFIERELLVNVNITIQKRKLENKLQKEQIEKNKLLGHFEKSPDLVIRMDVNQKILFINRVIFRYSGKQPCFYTGTHLQKCDLDDLFKTTVHSIVEKILLTRKVVNQEKELLTQMGERFIEINASPELNDLGEIDSILFVFRDITDQKIILQDMRSKNKKIIDSMSYSKQIQEAVIKNEIQDYFKNSFIYHKPKNIISGDFPWVLKQDDNIYAAAVDCTGHGIPGALMSLIIYLLLNEIMAKMKNIDPGTILDILHSSVQKTLNQINNESRDGADVALCRIDLRTNTLEFAGARRPLYHIRENGEFNQIKGDRFPIGGTQYSDRINFKTHSFLLNKNDRLFMFSDGYPDQFGGPDKMKFGQKRMRELFLNNYHVSMEELQAILEGSLNSWKKHEKQIDDILVLGIEYNPHIL